VGSNNDGTRTFWTVPIPESDVSFADGVAEMRVDNLSIGDFGSKKNALGPHFDTGFDPGVVSFDVVWNGPITREVTVPRGTLGNEYAGKYVEYQTSVTWSGTNLKTGFSFTANPGTFETSFFDGGFAELGIERNGIFLSSNSTDTGESLRADAVLTHALAVSTPTPASATTALLPPQVAAGSAAITASSRAVQNVSGPVQPPAGSAQAQAIDQLFTDLGSGLPDTL